MKHILLLFLIPSWCFAQYQPHVIWDRSGETDSSAYGYKILPLGDQNNDGFADWAVYAQGNGGGWHGTRASYLEFFHGGLTMPEEPYFTYRADTTVYYKLWGAMGIGDVNGDGYQDWMLRLFFLNNPPSYTIPIFYGGPQADSIPDILFPVTYQMTVFDMGDFNGDGYTDLYTYDQGNDIGRMYYGGSPMDTLSDWVLSQPPPGILQAIPYAIGDFNGDGALDFICYNPNPPFNLAIFLGGENPDTVPAYFWSNMLWPIGGVRSLNGDNADEFLLGLDVHFGRDSLHTTPDAVLNSEAGNEAVSAGDFNHDGYNDLILFTPTTGNNMFGALDLHLGHPWLNPDPVFTIEGSWPDGLIGIYSAAGLGDVNGDGIDDIAIGAWDDFAYLGWRGRCVIIAGDDSLQVSAENPKPELPQHISLEAYPNPFNGETNIEISLAAYHNDAEISVFNLLGQKVFRENIVVARSRITYLYDASALSTGLYLLHVRSGNLQTTIKLMVLR